MLAALAGYRNADGGYGWGLDPDLRSPESQPAAAHHAFEVFEEIKPATNTHAVALCDWLESISLEDGGLPFALPLRLTAGSGPWWQGPDEDRSSLQITSITAAAAHRVATHDPAVAAHPWLERATTYCMREIAALDSTPFAYVLAFSIQLLDTVHDTRPEAPQLLHKLGEHVPSSGHVAVTGGTEGETLTPLHLAPYPDRPARALINPDVVAADLERLAAGQRDGGGWTVDHLQISPAGVLDWRGYSTGRAIKILRSNGSISPDRP